MGKCILITSTDVMMVQFLLPHIVYLSENGFSVEIACSDVDGRMDEISQKLNGIVKNIFVVRLHRNPANFGNFNGYKDMKKVIASRKYDVIWTNEPVMGVVTRLAAKNARRNGTKVLYMVHGFHFFEGAPKLNWMFFYPIEKLMATKADVICTINQEDYKMAKTFQVNRVEYIHGIGVNTARLTISENRTNIRFELGLKDSNFIVLSVGELNKNKNQKTIIKAIAKLNDANIHYLLCGKGKQLDNLKKLANELGLKENVHFLGYRNDVVDICSQADVFVMPSYREGLPIASLEAMYCGLPLITSNIRGLSDVMENGISGYICNPDDVNGFAEGIRKLKNNPEYRKQMGVHNRKIVRPFCIDETKNEIMHLINDLTV